MKQNLAIIPTLLATLEHIIAVSMSYFHNLFIPSRSWYVFNAIHAEKSAGSLINSATKGA